MQKSTVSLRISSHLWLNDARRRELLALLTVQRETIDEVAFFTSFTHSVLPYDTLAARAELLARIIPEFKAIGLRVGINHLATLGHLDEDLDHALAEPWQRIVAADGTASRGCFCSLDPRFQEFIRRCYRVLATTGPDFIWIDDDVRMGHHPPAGFACFCDLCLARFAAETGEQWPRERALRVLHNEGTEASRNDRARWLEHNRRIIDDLLALIRGAVDEVDPNLQLGLMPCAMIYEGMAFDRWQQTLAGRRDLPVKWRPGGGFYTDARPLEALQKAHQMGRTAALLPTTVTDIQYEHENFPYQKLKKSETIFVAEAAAAVAAGCTGVALNLMGISPDSIAEYTPYFERMAAVRPFMEHLAATAGRSPAVGLWPAITPDIWAARLGPGLGDPLDCLTELAEIGLPPAYSRAGARVSLLAGDAVRAFTRNELEALLATGVLLDGPALRHLADLGLADLAGFAVAGTRDRDTIERFTADPLNGPHAGWWRDCRPSFWRVPAFVLEPLDPAARVLAELIDFHDTVAGPVMGIFENRLGGRVAVAGYYPWTSLQNLAKSTQMKALCQWLSGDRLPAFVSSFHKAAVWCRGGVVAVLNASLDTATGLRLHLPGEGPRRIRHQDGRETVATIVGNELELPSLPPFRMLLVGAMEG